MTLSDFIEELNIAIQQDGHDIYCNAITAEILKRCLTKQKEDKWYRPTGVVPPAQSGSHWFPCSERLPNDNDYRGCMECLDGAVWYFTENGTMGLGYYYKSTKEWVTTDDLRTDGKVIAWIPLPEPYKVESEE